MGIKRDIMSVAKQLIKEVLKMAKQTRKYNVDTGNNSSWHYTLDEAIKNYNKWVDFYYDNFMIYGERTITLSKDYKVIYLTDLSN